MGINDGIGRIRAFIWKKVMLLMTFRKDTQETIRDGLEGLVVAFKERVVYFSKVGPASLRVLFLLVKRLKTVCC